MKRRFKKLIMVIMCCSICLAGISCSGTLIDEHDPNKTQIFVNVYNGGNGVDWIKKIAKDFNEEHADSEYEIQIIGNLKYSISDIISEINSGTTTSVYYTVEPGIKDMIAQGLLEDMSDVYEMKVDGEAGKTIVEKMHDVNTVKQVFSGKNGEGLYGIPFSMSFLGLVYEHERFLDNNWYFFANGSDESVKSALDAQKVSYTINAQNQIYFESSEMTTNYKAGDRILTCGKDGIYGTYDDGQPQNITEWETLLNKIVSKGGYPLLWSGANPAYVDDILTGIYAQFDGLENYKLFSSYNGTYKSPTTGTEKTITPEKGYEIYQVSEGLRKGVEFLDTYFTNSEKYIHPFASYSSTSHRDAQDKFAFGYKNDGEIYLTGMLADGIWWENEAKASFNSLVTSGETDRGFGMKEFRYMLMPAFDNQVGIDGEGNGTVMAVRDSGAIIIKKNSNQEIVEWSKKFVAYTTSNESMRYFTKTTGVIRPYDYQLTDADFAEMTPFAKNVWAMYNDTENIAFVKPFMNNNISSINFASGKSKHIYQTVYQSVTVTAPLDVLKKTNANGYLNSLTTYAKSVWDQYYSTALNQWGGLN